MQETKSMDWDPGKGNEKVPKVHFETNKKYAAYWITEALGREEKESAQKELKILKIGPLKKGLFI